MESVKEIVEEIVQKNSTEKLTEAQLKFYSEAYDEEIALRVANSPLCRILRDLVCK